MVNLLTRIFVKNSDDTKNPDVRSAYGNMSGIVGIFLNLCLFAAKLTAGVFSSSISVVADAFNNLSDAGSSVVTFLGFKLANRPADKEHPFGHGRYEYVAGLGISVVILLVGIELLKSSIEKIFNPEASTEITLVSVCILIASVLVKLWMFYFNKILSKKISSSALKATSLDSLTDCVATTIVLIGLLISKYSGLVIDGYLGVAVAVFIIFAGINTFKDSLSPLLGTPPDADFVDDIRETVMQDEMIVGIHDLIVHDYGPGRCIISLHAEIPCDEDILKAHDSIDLVEKVLERKFNCLATIHMDPIAVDDEITLSLKRKVTDAVVEIDPQFSLHDFRVVHGETHTNLIFDLVIPHGLKTPYDEIRNLVKDRIQSIDPKLIPVMHIEKSYTE
ncbi:MAG: cation diffusion facilitator family transporter [Ruminococcus sp.]|nr:cation diffusion facilitator family transporter [Ruminococcus sp.]